MAIRTQYDAIINAHSLRLGTLEVGDPGVFNVTDPAYGAVGDGTADDTTAIQAAITAAEPTNATVYFPAGNYKTTTQLEVDASIVIQGSGQYTCRILAVGVSGIKINKIDNFQMLNIEIKQAVRHTDTPNTNVGIDIDGDTTDRPFNHVYRDVYVDGFKTAFRSSWLWASRLDNFRTDFGAIGIHARDLSVNNMVLNCNLGGDSAAGSRGIWLDGRTQWGETWIISDGLLDRFEIGILGQGFRHVKVVNSIVDHNVAEGITIDDNGTDFASNWTISGNYIAMDGASGNAAIVCNNTKSHALLRGNQIYGNEILVYAGKVANYGVYMVGAEAKHNTIIGNTITGFALNDFRGIAGNNNVFVANICLSSITNNIAVADVIADNIGTVVGFPVLTFGAADTTPTIKTNDILAGTCLTGGAVTITDFDDGRVGDEFSILAAHTVTITHNASIIALDGGANFGMLAGDTLTLTMFNDSVWQEVSRTTIA